MVYPLLPRQMALLEETYTLHRYDLARDADEREEVLAAAGPASPLVVTASPPALLERLPNLRLVACSGVGSSRSTWP